jgi:hypothetical protein
MHKIGLKKQATTAGGDMSLGATIKSRDCGELSVYSFEKPTLLAVEFP